jgi:hypothetical protein
MGHEGERIKPGIFCSVVSGSAWVKSTYCEGDTSLFPRGLGGDGVQTRKGRI